jgi:hypothetical protein
MLETLPSILVVLCVVTCYQICITYVITIMMIGEDLILTNIIVRC